MAKKIELSQGQFAQVDDEDYDRASVYNWFAFKSKRDNTFYALSTVNKSPKKGEPKTYALRLHRFIMNCPKDKLVDHIDGNGLNCQKINMRICTQQQNGKNQTKQKGNLSSKYKGVYFCNASKSFKAQIGLNRQRIHLGYFKDEDSAAKAYNNKAIELHGEFAKLNQIKQ